MHYVAFFEDNYKNDKTIKFGRPRDEGREKQIPTSCYSHVIGEFVKAITKLYFIYVNYNIVKMSKRKALPSVLTIDKVMNHINTWPVDEDQDREEVEDLNDLCGELDKENGNNQKQWPRGDLSEGCL